MGFGAWCDGRATLRVIPRVHVVTDDEILARPDFETHAREVCEACGVWVQSVGGKSALRRLGGGRGAVALHLRGPHTSGRTLSRLARGLSESAPSCGVQLFLNDRLDVALAVGVTGAVGPDGAVGAGAVGAIGVHLGARSIPPVEARRLVGAHRLLGVSVHNVEEAVRAAESGADYLFVGTLFETSSHPAAAVKGAELMSQVATRVDLPLIGIGGVTPERTADVLASSGHGIAAIRGVWDAPSPQDAVQAYLDAVERAIE